MTKANDLKERYGQPCFSHSNCRLKHDIDDEGFECSRCGYAPDCISCELWTVYYAGVAHERQRCLNEIASMRKALASRKDNMNEGTLAICLSFIKACEVDIQLFTSSPKDNE